MEIALFGFVMTTFSDYIYLNNQILFLYIKLYIYFVNTG